MLTTGQQSLISLLSWFGGEAAAGTQTLYFPLINHHFFEVRFETTVEIKFKNGSETFWCNKDVPT
jgi:hypothetical protein